MFLGCKATASVFIFPYMLLQIKKKFYISLNVKKESKISHHVYMNSNVLFDLFCAACLY